MSGAKNVGSTAPGGIAPTRLRQIALVTNDLEKARRQLTYVLGTEVIFEDPAVGQWGLKNMLLPLGGDIIEVVAPIKEETTAGRLLQKRGEGGYMIIMQTEDAGSRRKYIEEKKLAKVIWGYDHGDVVAAQYHPKGIPGGMMPELDSHAPTPDSPTPLKSRFSPWHACGSDHKTYYPGMKRSAHLSLEGCSLRISPDQNHEKAAQIWEEIFGVGRSRDMLAFTNVRLGFSRGYPGQPEGLISITVGVNGKEKLEAIWDRAKKEGLTEDKWINMCGVKWFLVLTGYGEAKGKL